VIVLCGLGGAVLGGLLLPHSRIVARSRFTPDE
jgi:hypothetical protein